MGVLNLHDTFLQASLMKKHMLTSPLTANETSEPHVFLISDYGRFERLWVAFLYVLIEAWSSDQMSEVREYCQSIVPLEKLNSLLNDGELEGLLSQMRETRHYVFHRDKREYWDNGRIGPVGNLNYNLSLHQTFSTVLLAAVQNLPPTGEEPPNPPLQPTRSSGGGTLTVTG